MNFFLLNSESIVIIMSLIDNLKHFRTYLISITYFLSRVVMVQDV